MNMDYLFSLQGSIFEKGIPIHIASKSLFELQNIFDKTFLITSGKQRITPKQRKKFYLQTETIKHSSLQTYFDIIMGSMQVMLPVYQGIGPENIWNLTKSSYDFLKLLFQAHAQGKSTHISVTDNSECTLTIQGDNSTTYNAPVLNIAKLSISNWQEMYGLLSDGGISDLSLGHGDNPEIKVNESERELFNLPTKTEKEPLEPECNIIEFNKTKKTGKLIVPKGQPLKEGNYKFTTVGNQEISKYIESMLYNRVRIHCLKETVFDPLAQKEIIIRLHVVDVLSRHTSSPKQIPLLP